MEWLLILTVEIPDELLVRFQKEADARGLTLNQWLVQLAEEHGLESAAGPRGTTAMRDVFAKVRGLADDLDVGRDHSPGRDVVL